MRPPPLPCLALLLALGAAPAQAASEQVTQADGLPPRAYAIQGKPSEVAQNREAVLLLALQVEADLKAALEGPSIRDERVLQRLHGDLYAIAVLKQDQAGYRRHLEMIRSMQASPAGRLLAGLSSELYLQATEKPGADFHATFRALLSQRLAALPFEEVRGPLEGSRAWLRALAKAQVVAGLEAGLDPAAKGGKLTLELAEGILGAAVNLTVILGVRDDAVACLDAAFEAHPAAAARPAVKYAPVLGTPRAPVKGPWFGQPLPGQKPVPFAPDLLEAINPWAEGVAFSPDGAECFLGVGSAGYSGAATFHSSRVNGTWTPFVEPAFLSDFTYSNEPDFSADGRAVTFTGKKEAGSKDFWTARRTAKGWGEAVALPAPLNSDSDEFRGSTTLDGTVYFGRTSDGMMQIHRAARDASGSLVVERLGAPVNARFFEGDPCVAPDGHFLVFYSARPGGLGGSDLYVSFRDGKGDWGTPINLGPDFNSADDEYGAHLSADGKLLFFTRHGARRNFTFWVAASAIERFRP
jgi:WD40-like Beta Propeller Repeat